MVCGKSKVGIGTCTASSTTIWCFSLPAGNGGGLNSAIAIFAARKLCFLLVWQLSILMRFLLLANLEYTDLTPSLCICHIHGICYMRSRERLIKYGFLLPSRRYAYTLYCVRPWPDRTSAQNRPQGRPTLFSQNEPFATPRASKVLLLTDFKGRAPSGERRHAFIVSTTSVAQYC